MSYLALDVGDRRIGVAASDESNLIATPLTVIRRTSKAEDYRKIANMVRERGAEGLVVGHPLNADGSAGPQAQRIERFTAALEQALLEEGLDLEVLFWDEYLSTQRAQERMLAAGRKAKDRRARLDAVAAAVILQDYLDAQRSAGPGPEEVID